MPLLDESIALNRADNAAKNKGGLFLGFVGGKYAGKRTKCILRCPRHGSWETTQYHNLVALGRWCPECSPTKKLGEASVRTKIQVLCEARGYVFHGFPYEYTNVTSKIELGCSNENHANWICAFSDFQKGKGCPSCAAGGFSPDAAGWLYALISSDGASIKVGITNAFSARMTRLKRETPFEFTCLMKRRFTIGAEARTLEKYFHEKYEKAGYSGFEGATEWLKYSPSLMAELHNSVKTQ